MAVYLTDGEKYVGLKEVYDAEHGVPTWDYAVCDEPHDFRLTQFAERVVQRFPGFRIERL